MPVRAGGRGLAGDVCDDLVFGWVSRDEFSSAVSSELAAFGAQECPLFFFFLLYPGGVGAVSTSPVGKPRQKGAVAVPSAGLPGPGSEL